MKFLRFTLFIVLAILLSSGLVRQAYATVTYQGLNWTDNACVVTVVQGDVSGVFPNQIVEFLFIPQNTNTICLNITQAKDCFSGDNPCWYEGSFTIDYQSYTITTSPSINDNTSIVIETGVGGGGNGLGFNTSSTHIANNQALLTFDIQSAVAVPTIFDYENLVLGQSVGCGGFFNINADAEYTFIYQMRNESSIDVWLGNSTYAMQRWCNFTRLTQFDGYRLGSMRTGYTEDDGSGAGSSNMKLSVRGLFQGTGCLRFFEHTVASSLENFTCTGSTLDPTGITVQAFNSDGEITQNHVVGQVVRFQALLLNISDPFSVGEIRLGNQPLTISRGGIVQATSITNTTGWALFLVTPAGASGDSITYTVGFGGDSSRNLAGTTTDIVIILVPVGSLSFQGTALGRVTARDEDFQPRTIFIHNELIRFRVRLTDSLGNPIPDQAIVFHTDKNSTGTFIVSQVADTNSQGVAVTALRRIDNSFVGITQVQARYQGDLQFQAANSTIFSFTVVSTADQFDLTIRIEPNPVNPGATYRIFGALELIQPDGLRQPLPDENVQVFRADFGEIFQFLDSKRTNTNGLYQISTQNAEPAGSLTIVFRANASINSIGIISNNITLTINAIGIVEDDLPVGGANLDDFFPDIDDIDFGFGSTEGNGILLWLIFFLMFGFGGIFAMNATFPSAMNAQLVMAWFIMMFGASTGVSFGLGWIGLNFVILLIAPIALIGGIVLLRIFRGGGTT